MGLVADNAVDHVGADLLEFCRPVQVGFFVEAREQFDNHRDFLAASRRFDEVLHQHRVGAGAIHGLLDGHHVRIVGRLLKELDDRIE